MNMKQILLFALMAYCIPSDAMPIIGADLQQDAIQSVTRLDNKPAIPADSFESSLEALKILKPVDTRDVLTTIAENQESLRQEREVLHKAKGEQFKDLQTVLYATKAPTIRYNTSKREGDLVEIVEEELSLPIRFGIYKRDIIDGGIYAANMVADYYLYKKMKSNRVDFIVNQLLTHSKETEQFLKLHEQAVDDNQKTIIGKGVTFAKRVAQQQMYMRLKASFKKFIDDQYSCSSYNPLSGKFFINKKTAPLIAGKLALFGITDYLEKRYVIPDYGHALEQGALSYKKDKDGNMVKEDITNPHEAPPISMLMLLKLATHPKLFFQSARRNASSLSKGITHQMYRLLERIGLPMDYNESSSSSLSALNVFIPRVQMPQFLQRPLVQKALSFASDIAMEGLSIKFFDSYCHVYWSAHLTKYYPELVALLNKYTSLKEEAVPNKGEMIKVEKKIRKFVQEAHEPAWFLPAHHWYRQFFYDYRASGFISQIASIPAVAGIGYWFYKWYKKN